MSIYLNYLFNAILIILVTWGWFKYCVPNLDLKVYFVAGLSKVFLGFVLGLLYYEHYRGGDTIFYFEKAYGYRDWPILDFLQYEFSSISLALPSRAILFTRIAAAVAYFSRGDYWVLSAYFSCFSFLGVSYLVSKITRIWESLKWPAIVALFFYPSVVFWSSGLIKESIAFGGMSLLIGSILSIIYIKKYGLGLIVLIILGALLLITLKYYIAALVIPCLVFLVVYKTSKAWSFMPHSEWKKGFLIALVLFFPALIFLQSISYNFSIDRFFEIVQISHNTIIEQTSESNSVSTLVIFSNSIDYFFNTLYYMFSGLFRPLIFENWSFPSWLSALENSLVLVVVLFSFYRLKTWKDKISIELVISIIYTLTASVMLTYSLPNLGAIARFKVYYMPFLMIPLIYILRLYIIDKRV